MLPCLVPEDLERYDLQREVSESILVQIQAPKETSVGEHHLGFHTRVVVVLSIDFAENLEGQVAGAMGRRYTPDAKLVLHLSRELRNIAVEGEQVESTFDEFNGAAKILFGRTDNLFDFAVRAARDQKPRLFLSSAPATVPGSPRGRDARARSAGRR